MNPHSLIRKKELGAYYTPPELCQALANWAISDEKDAILEPSFGGCGFFDSCILRLNELNCSTPEKQIYGADIDPLAFDILSQKFGTLLSLEKRFLHNDFIQLIPEDYLIQKFDIVLGNPPYVSMHNMSDKQRKSCDNVLRSSKFSCETMGRNASLWAFFLLHSLTFLKETGKVAWILPSSILNADYAKKLIEIHKKHFNEVKIIKLAERYFRSEGAEESSVVLVANGFSSTAIQCSHFSYHSVDNIDELTSALLLKNKVNIAESDNYKLEIIPTPIKELFFRLSDSKESLSLGSLMNIKIGMVTGANKLFIIDKKTVEKNFLPECVLKPVVGRFSSLIGLRHTNKRHFHLQNNNHKCYLVNVASDEIINRESDIRKYLSAISEKEISENRTFQKRKNWFAPDDNIIPDGFLTYMIHLSPRIVLNQAKINCTNSIHKVFFHKKLTFKNKIAIAVSLLSSYSQFSAEIEGRAYSSGVLKIEPTAGKRIKILLNDTSIEKLNSISPDLEKHLSNNNFDLVTKLVDQALIDSQLITAQEIDTLTLGIKILRKERYNIVRSSDGY